MYTYRGFTVDQSNQFTDSYESLRILTNIHEMTWSYQWSSSSDMGIVVLFLALNYKENTIDLTMQLYPKTTGFDVETLF